jgi:hypothetical protein
MTPIKKNLYLFLLCTCLANLAYSQTSTKKNKKIFKKAEDAYDRADYLKAYHLYSENLKNDSANYKASFKAGLCLFNLSKTDTAPLKYFIKAKRVVPEAHFYVGRIYHMQNESQKALEELFYFRTINNEGSISQSEVNDWIKKCEAAIKEGDQRENYDVKNIGPQVNTQYPEYVPLLWNLNGSLVFTSRRPDSKGGQVDPYGKYYEDIYISNPAAGGWGTPRSLSDKLNTETHDACVAFSPDGLQLIIYRTDETKTAGDLYLSTYESDGWSAPVIFGPEINSEYLETSACFSAYANVLIFSSNRPGGYGGRDLYRVVKFLNGSYSLPVNLGPEINTAEDEDAPYIDKNDNTLYFSSRGHNTMGEYDIFKSLYDATADKWLNPENMGQPVNSTNDDIYFTKQNNVAYFTSRREGGYGEADIYEVNFSKSNKVIVYCKINSQNLDAADLEDFKISLFNPKTEKLEGLYNRNTNYMNAVLLVTIDQEYELKVEGKNIKPIVKRITFNTENKELVLDLNGKSND